MTPDTLIACKTCRRGYYASRGHTCPPAWIVWDEATETEEDALTVYADRATQAAEAWGERQGDPTGDELWILVVRQVDGDHADRRVELGAEARIEFSGRIL